MERTIVIVVPDLMFQPRIAEAARRLGASVRIAESPASADAALADAPAATVVDLHAEGIDAIETVRRASEAGARVLAFGRHTEPATLRAARDAGAEIVVPRSQLVEELTALLRRLLEPREARAQ